MGVIGKRHGGYKAGIVIGVLGIVAFIVGFATENWNEFTFTVHGFTLKGHEGLWSTCVQDEYGGSHCFKTTSSRNWMTAVRGLQCTALVLMFIAGCFNGYINFFASNPSHNKLLEILIPIAGFLGVSGAITYAAKSQSDVEFIKEQVQQLDLDFYLSWSFGVNVAGCGILFIAAFLIGVYNKPLQVPASTPPVHFTTMAPGAQVTTAGGMGYVIAAPGTGNPYAVPAEAPPAYYSQIQGQGQGHGYGQIQGQASPPAYDPMVMYTNLPATKQ